MARRSLNKVLILGRLGRDPEIRYTGSGKAVATFTVATSQTWKDQGGENQERTEWHRIVAWDRLGEICNEYLTKGSQVYIEGRLQSRDWEDSNGNKRSTTEIVANDLIMLGSKGGEKRQERPTQNKPAPTQSKGADYAPPPEDEVPF